MDSVLAYNRLSALLCQFRPQLATQPIDNLDCPELITVCDEKNANNPHVWFARPGCVLSISGGVLRACIH